MSDTNKTGGAAFPLQYDPYIDHPSHGRIHRNEIGEEVQEGMTLLDYVAANISPYILVNVGEEFRRAGNVLNDGVLPQEAYGIAAAESYKFSKAMIEERKKHM